jgi:hypothetical protein
VEDILRMLDWKYWEKQVIFGNLNRLSKYISSMIFDNYPIIGLKRIQE